MPLYRVKQSELEIKIALLEAAGEVITQVGADPDSLDAFLVITSKPTNDTGRAWSPEGMKETR